MRRKERGPLFFFRSPPRLRRRHTRSRSRLRCPQRSATAPRARSCHGATYRGADAPLLNIPRRVRASQYMLTFSCVQKQSVAVVSRKLFHPGAVAPALHITMRGLATPQLHVYFTSQRSCPKVSDPHVGIPTYSHFGKAPPPPWVNDPTTVGRRPTS